MSVGDAIEEWKVHLMESPHSPVNWIKQMLGLAEPAREGGGIIGSLGNMMPKTSLSESFGSLSPIGKESSLIDAPSREIAVEKPSIVAGFDASTLASLKGLGQTIQTGEKPAWLKAESSVGTQAVTFAMSDVVEISSPANTPSSQFAIQQKQQQAGMAM